MKSATSAPQSASGLTRLPVARLVIHAKLWRNLMFVPILLLLALGILLMVMLSIWPQHHPWLAAKIVALLVYIVLGSVAIPTLGLPAGVAALTWIEDITDA